MSSCRILRMVLGSIQTNCYLIYNEETSEMIVMDPADQEQMIEEKAHSLGASIKAILLTHGHFDHIRGADGLRSDTNAPIYAPAPEKELLESVPMNLSAEFGQPLTLKADCFLQDEEILLLCGLKLRMILTPGHTKGSGCYYLAEENILFSGDTLFAQGCGRTDFPTGDMEALTDSIRNRLFLLPDETRVLPGHGPETQIGWEKQFNPMAE